MSRYAFFLRLLPCVLLTALLTGCAGSPAAPVVGVAISPSSVALIGGATQTFAAMVTNDATNAGVTWSASIGTITAAGIYTAPQPVTALSATVTATSKFDTTKTATATIMLTPISVTVTPAAVTLAAGATQAFTATVASDGANAGVTWTASVGTITSGGVYTAPSAVTTTTATITATSKTDPSRTATAAVTLTPITVSAITPATVTLGSGGSQNFTVSVANDSSNSGVTWSIGNGAGSLTASNGTSVTYNAPTTAITSATTVVLTATSAKDPSKTSTATITLQPIAVSFSTSTTGISLDSGQTLRLAAIVAYDSSASGVNFAAAGAGTVNPPTATSNVPATTLTASSLVAATVTVTATSIKDATRSASTASIAINPTLAISTAGGALTAGTTGTVYAGAAIASTGGSGAISYAIASGSLPLGLSLSTSTGAISGTPTGTAGTATFTVRVTDSATTPVTVTSNTYTIAVRPAPLVWVSPATSTLTYTVGTAITPIALTTTGGTGSITYSVDAGALPQGLQLVGNQVTGTPTAPTVSGGNVVSFLATDSATPAAVTAVSSSVTLIANPVTLAITSSGLPIGTVGAAYSDQLTSTGGTGAITWSLSAGSLSGTGLTLSNTGLLAGTPTATQSGLSLTFQARDAATNQQQTVTKALLLNIFNAITITNGGTLPIATTGVGYSQSLAVAGGSGSGYTWTVTSGATGTNSLATLNLSVSTAGIVSGTPASSGTANFTVQVKDSSNNTTSASFTVTAYAPLALPAANPSTLGAATIASSYTGSITATGGVPGYNWTVNGSNASGGSVSLGNGTLAASSSGPTLNISGTPATTGTVSFSASVTDSKPTTAGPINYTIAVSTTYNVSGQISLTTSCGSVASTLPSISVTLSQGSTTIQTQTTNSTGNFTFSNVPNGTYTVTPSISGPTSAFYPATQTVTVNNGNISSTTFNVALGYTVSGTVGYGGMKTGRVYVSLVPASNCGSGLLGTSISAAGAFTIHGVAPGTYTLQSFLDNLGKGSQNASNPAGSIGGVTVSTANVTGQSVTLGDPTAATLSAAPKLSSVVPFNSGAITQYKPITDSNGVELATSYTLQWSTTSSFTSIAGSKTFPANGTHQTVWFLNGLTDGTNLYFRAYGTSAGTPISPYSSIIGPITIGAATAGNLVTGSISFTGTATGPLYTGLFDQNTGTFYGQYIASPVSAQAYSVYVPTGSNYILVGLLDQNNNGLVDSGDITNTANGNNNQPVTVVTGTTANANLTLPATDAVASIYTGAFESVGSSTSQNYSLNFQINNQIKQPVAVTLASGPNIIAPLDIALCIGGNNSCGRGFQLSANINSNAPNVGDTYTFNVTYSDGTTGTITATVSAVLNAFATSLAPQTGTSTSTTPTFTWVDPVSASNYTYQFSINDATAGTIWQIPGNNSSSNGFSSSITSITWGTDPTGGGSMPTVGSLTTGTTYNWQIQVQDANGNFAVTTVQYQP